ncbi:MAG: hypothetical protein RL616_791 [Verrucomicrobiota bacterium]
MNPVKAIVSITMRAQIKPETKPPNNPGKTARPPNPMASERKERIAGANSTKKKMRQLIFAATNRVCDGIACTEFSGGKSFPQNRQ